MRFSGTLQTQGNPDSWLKTSLNLDGGRVEIVAGDESLGSWSVAQVKAERVEGNRFDLYLGDERAVFVADDALAFSYEALPKLTKSPIVEVAQGFRQRLRGSSRKAKPADAPPPSQPEAAPPVPSVSDSIAWYEPPEEAPPNVKRLRELIEAARANRAENPGDQAPQPEPAAEEAPAEPLVVAVDPPLMLLDPEPEPLWAGSELGRRIKPMLEVATEPRPRLENPPLLTAGEDTKHPELVAELNELLTIVSSGSLTEAQAEAAATLVRSLRALLDS